MEENRGNAKREERKEERGLERKKWNIVK